MDNQEQEINEVAAVASGTIEELKVKKQEIEDKLVELNTRRSELKKSIKDIEAEITKIESLTKMTPAQMMEYILKGRKK